MRFARQIEKKEEAENPKQSRQKGKLKTLERVS